MKNLLSYKLFEYLNVEPGDKVLNIKKDKEAKFIKWQNPNKTMAKIEYADGSNDIVRTLDLNQIDENNIEKLFKALEKHSDDLSYKITRTKDGNEIIKVENTIYDTPNLGDRPRYHSIPSKINPDSRFYITITPQENDMFKITATRGTIEKPIEKMELNTDDKYLTVDNLINVLNRYSFIADEDDYQGANKFFDDMDNMDYFTTYSTI
jgi:hypothetical protein